jgi:hypothetical protein
MWYVHYESELMVGLRGVKSLEQAVGQACGLLDRGLEVSKIEDSGYGNSVSVEEIRAAYVKRK